MTPSKLRLLTLNTWAGDGAYAERMDWMEAELRRVDADVVCLQETFRLPRTEIDTAKRLAAALGFELAEVRSRLMPRKYGEGLVDCFSGLALLSRFPIVASEGRALPSSPRDNDSRSAQLCRLDVGGVEVAVANTHLCYLPESGPLRREQLRMTLNDLRGFAGGRAAFVLGDMNTIAESKEMRPFLERDGEVLLRDGYAEGGGPHPSSSLTEHSVADGGGGDLRLDHIFAAEWGGEPPVAFSDAALVLGERSTSGVFASDHLGVAVTARVG